MFSFHLLEYTWFTLLRVTWQPFGWIFMRCFSWTSRGRTGQIGLWFRRAFIIAICIQSLTTASRNCLGFIFACGLRMLYTLKELESPQFIRYSTIFFFVHFMVFLRMGQHVKELIRTVNAFHVGAVFLHAGRFYHILSRFSCCRDRVSWIVNVQTSCLSSQARRFSPFLENNMPPFFILDVCIFKFGSKPPLSLIVPPLSLIVPPLSL